MSDADDPNALKSTLNDPGQPWWWRKLAGPSLDHFNDNLPPEFRHHDVPFVKNPWWDANEADWTHCRYCTFGIPLLPDRRVSEHYTNGSTDPVWQGRLEVCRGSFVKSRKPRTKFDADGKPIKPTPKPRPNWGGLYAVCTLCKQTVPLIADGRVAVHFKDDSTDPSGHPPIIRCDGSHARVARADTVAKPRPAANAHAPRSFPWGYLVLAEVVVTLGIGVWGALQLLGSAGGNDIAHGLAAFVIGVSAILMTSAVWIRSSLDKPSLLGRLVIVELATTLAFAIASSLTAANNDGAQVGSWLLATAISLGVLLLTGFMGVLSKLSLGKQAAVTAGILAYTVHDERRRSARNRAESEQQRTD